MRVKRVQIKVQSLEEQSIEFERVLAAARAGKKIKPVRVLAFESAAVMRKFLTPKRQLLIRMIRRKEPSSVYELAGIVGRDRKAVAEDLKVLENLGLISYRTSVRNGRARSQPVTAYDAMDIRVSW